jgi:hypothetical protein
VRSDISMMIICVRLGMKRYCPIGKKSTCKEVVVAWKDFPDPVITITQELSYRP